jgi:uncharacterized protein (UPF0548 family)
VFFLTQPSGRQIGEFLAQQSSVAFSYAGVGLSREAKAPRHFVIDRNRALLGSGEAAWSAAKQAIRNWRMFNFPWIELCWSNTPIEQGATVAIVVSHFGVFSLNASRIVYVIDEPRRFGFAYGTLLQHAESGEERFLVEWNETDDSVWYDLFAFSRPRAMQAKLAAPLARRLQKKFARDSLVAMQSAVRSSEPPTPQ